MTTTAGYLRLTNKRAGMGPKPKPHETIVDFDRNNPVLGNRHILHNHLDEAERTRVIAAYGVDLEADWAIKGPKYQEISKLAEGIINGQQYAARCWCAPRRCHGELILHKIKSIIRETHPEHPFLKNGGPTQTTLPLNAQT